MKKMNKRDNILRIDLDIKTKRKAIEHLKERLNYLIHLNWFKRDTILKVELNKKKTYGCKIYLSKYVSIDYMFRTQLLLGSDYKKECCAMINYYKLGMTHYFDRLFEHKRYPNGKFKHSKLMDVTNEIFENEIK